MFVPLLVRGNAIGLLAVATDQDDRVFASDQVRLAETVASDVAGAIENARLFERVQAAAAAEERSRLARDLHDAVTQTIYSATLIAEALPQVWARDAAEGQRNLVKLRQLVRGALAEMRTLLFELRPAALEAADLGTLLEHQANSLTGRTRIPVTVAVEPGIEVPTDVRVALYRIAQEALTNIAKHASATEVDVSLHRELDRVALSIRDNGRGFDSGSVTGEGMGLRIMRERAERVGAEFAVKSAQGRGTEVAVVWGDDQGR
jgi:signal transduction histidine kinase